MIRSILFFVALCILSAGSQASPPKPVESEYFLSRDAGIYFSGREGLRYALFLDLRSKPLGTHEQLVYF
jgi:hypothetical protein